MSELDAGDFGLSKSLIIHGGAQLNGAVLVLPPPMPPLRPKFDPYRLPPGA
jgi:hypothetical protein